MTLLSVIDFELTHTLIEFGKGAEANPIFLFLIGVTGTIWSILWWKFICLGAFLTTYFTTQKHTKVWSSSIVTAGLVATNIVLFAAVVRATIILFH